MQTVPARLARPHPDPRPAGHRPRAPRTATATTVVALGAAAVTGLTACSAAPSGAPVDTRGPAPAGTQGAGPVPGTAGAQPRDRLPQGSEPVLLDPSNFTTAIDNPYAPLTPGSRWVYRETDTEGTVQRVVVTVTDREKKLANGITARVVRDVVTEHGQTVEATDDWYAQDSAGNVWYLGEDTAEYTGGRVSSREGSFEAGVDGAQPGIAMPAHPVPGLSYRQEYYAGHAEDRAGVVSIGAEQVEVPYGHYSDAVLMTRDLVPLEPRVQELKLFAPGVGLLLSVHLDGTGGRAELLSYTPGR